jgi:hypothetical protein
MKTTRKYELIHVLGSILADKRSQANYRLEEEILPSSASVSSRRTCEEVDMNHKNL